MQRPHRQRHRIIWLALAPLIAAVIFLAVRSRSEFPVEPPTPSTQR
jgi:hypothetical protein